MSSVWAMIKNRLALLPAVLILAGGAASADGFEPARTAPVVMAAPIAATAIYETHTIDIVRFKFAPAELTVRTGDHIIWVNKDLVPHTATTNDEGWDTGSLSKNDTWELVAGDTGTFNYICTFHPGMKGAITVE